MSLKRVSVQILYLYFFLGVYICMLGLKGIQKPHPVVSQQIVKFYFVEYVDALLNFNANVPFEVFKMQCFCQSIKQFPPCLV